MLVREVPHDRRKKGGLPAAITDDLQASRFFTGGGGQLILLVEKNGREIFLILFSR
jgi:hypothetical protein